MEFIPRRQTWFKIWKSIIIIYHINSQKEKVTVTSIGTKKSIWWNLTPIHNNSHLTKNIRNVLNLIEKTYPKSIANIMLYGKRQCFHPILQTKQGCPFSLLLHSTGSSCLHNKKINKIKTKTKTNKKTPTTNRWLCQGLRIQNQHIKIDLYFYILFMNMRIQKLKI